MKRYNGKLVRCYFNDFNASCTNHLDSIDVLLLLHINMSNVHPHITEVSCCFSDLSEDVSCLIDVAFVGQYST